MDIIIKAMDRRALQELDEIFEDNGKDTWREPNGINPDGTYDVTLNDAWMEAVGCRFYIVMDDLRLLLFTSLFKEIQFINP